MQQKGRAVHGLRRKSPTHDDGNFYHLAAELSFQRRAHPHGRSAQSASSLPGRKTYASMGAEDSQRDCQRIHSDQQFYANILESRSRQVECEPGATDPLPDSRLANRSRFSDDTSASAWLRPGVAGGSKGRSREGERSRADLLRPFERHGPEASNSKSGVGQIAHGIPADTNNRKSN